MRKNTNAKRRRSQRCINWNPRVVLTRMTEDDIAHYTWTNRNGYYYEEPYIKEEPVDDYDDAVPGTLVTWDETQIKIEVDTSLIKTEPLDIYENAIKNSTFSNLCGTFNCKICFQVFNNYEDFVVHKNLAHKNIHKYECQLCNEKFNLSAHLNSHMLGHIHTKNTPLTLPSITQSSSSSDSTKKQKRMSNCKIIEVEPSNTNSKNSFNNEYNSYRCNLCFKSYVNQSSLNGHMRFHSFNGDIISKRNLKRLEFNKRWNKNNVIQSKNNNFAKNKKTLVCNICNKRFVLQKRLTMHQQLHKSVKIINSKQNSTGKSLKHNKAPKITVKFESSDAKFKELNHLHNVQLTPFQCSHCENYYSSKKTLSEHTRQFHNYAVSNPLYKVRKTPTSKCNLCNAVVCNLKRHIKNLHSNEN